MTDHCSSVEAHAAERQNSRRKLVRNAKAKMDDNLENQKVRLVNRCGFLRDPTADYTHLCL